MSLSWLNIDPESPFSLSNLPFGIFSTTNSNIPRVGVAIGDLCLDLALLYASDVFSQDATLQQHGQIFQEPTLNSFAALGRSLHRAYRLFIKDLLLLDTLHPALLKDNDELRSQALIPLDTITMHVPLNIGDYTDFYAGRNHAYNAGVLFRGPENALQPNYLHLPVGYHGRASSIQISDYPVRRPNGQMLSAPGTKKPIFGPCKKLDFELEVGAFLCTPNEQGSPIKIDDASDHIFGFVLLNDWSARDIQAWEAVPLGPFNSKNFATTISPWVVLADALESHRTVPVGSPSPQDLLPYLRQSRNDVVYDIQINVNLKANGRSRVISISNSKYLCFSFEQMLAHHSITGCPLRTGDLLGSGTISGEDDTSLGSLLEMSRNGKDQFVVAEGVSRTFLEDGDEIEMTARAGKSGAFVGFGACRGVILPAWPI